MAGELEDTITAPGVPPVSEAVDSSGISIGQWPDVVLGVGDAPCAGRFSIDRLLGRGGMGEVFLALDAEREELVALKTLQKGGADAIARIKWEFRSLADVTHPNIVRLYELFEDSGHWFFTMEYVKGRPLVGPELYPASTPLVEIGQTRSCGGLPLRQAFLQLAEGIDAIHAAGKLHRDLKPSNVLVDDQNRVVILDFGLVASVHGEETDGSIPVLGGTPAYLSPEQAAGRRATRSSDWYSFGVMLYEALQGSLPFDGTVAEVLAAKQKAARPPPLTGGQDDELGALCMALLARDPLERAGSDEVRRVLGGSITLQDANVGSLRPPFVGRTSEVQALFEALDVVEGGRPHVVLMPGPSGIGKTTLMEEFCRKLRQERDALVLSTRCYEREKVPFNALDTGVETLVGHLAALAPSEARALVPPGFPYLTRLFPEFERLQWLMPAGGTSFDFGDDLQDERRKAFGVLAELLRALSKVRPVVLAMDDLQWMDVDSSRLIMGILTLPEPPPVLLVGTARSEGMGGDRPLGMLLRSLARADVPLRVVQVAPLGERDSFELVQKAVPSLEAAVTHGIVRDAGGSPFYALQLTYYHRVGQFRADVGVDEMLRAQVEALPEGARVFLQAAAVSPAATPRSILNKVAARLCGGQEPTAALRHSRLIRAETSGGNPLLVPYHDRVRDAILCSLTDPERKRLHRCLAEVWLDEDSIEAEVLLTHLHSAGEDQAAAPYALRAAEQAESGLAFDRAAELYDTIIRLLSPAPAARTALLIKRGSALAHAGRAGDAAHAFLEASSFVGGGERSELRWRAVEQLLQSRTEATSLLLDVLAELGVPAPSARKRNLRILGRGLRDAFLGSPAFEAGPESSWDRAAMAQFDYFVTAGFGLFFGRDLDLCIYLLSECVTLGRKSREPGRVACALAIYLGSIVQVKHATLEHVLARATEVLTLAEQSCDAQTSAVARLLLGQTLYQAGAPRAALVHFTEARDMLRALSPRGLQLAECAGISCLLMQLTLGDLGDCRPLAAEAIELGEARSQPFFRRAGSFTLAMLALAADNLPAAEEHHRRIVGDDQDPLNGWFKASALQLRAYLDVALGTPDAHLDQFEEGCRQYRSLVETHHYRPWVLLGHGVARIACAQRASGQAREQHLKQAARVVSELQSKSGVRVLRPYGQALWAAIHGLRGDLGRATEMLEQAENGFTSHGMMAYRNMVALAKAKVLGGTLGADMTRDAEAALRDVGVRSPERLTCIHFPGLFEADRARDDVYRSTYPKGQRRTQ